MMSKKKLEPPQIDRSRIEVKTSPIHGKGVFVRKPIKKGKAIIEYKGEIISWKLAEKRHPHDPKDPNHTFYFLLEDGRCIDAKYGGNAARWINHSCKPSCEAREERFNERPRVFIYAKRDLKVGEELFYDYALGIDGRITKQMKKDYACRCGAKKCRATMLAVKEK
jgi:SET domain-containing protein